jgi:hypothetical protein
MTQECGFINECNEKLIIDDYLSKPFKILLIKFLIIFTDYNEHKDK